MITSPLGSPVYNVNMGLDELMELAEQLRQSPEQGILIDIDSVQWSLRVFKGNCDEVIRLLGPIEESPEAFILWTQGHKAERDTVYLEVGRLLHNFLASAMSLVDRARNHVNKLYAEKPFADEYTVEVNRCFANNPHHRVVQGLRNYVLHRALPDVESFHSVSFAENSRVGEDRRMLRLPTAPLLMWDGWHPIARRSLEDMEEGLPIREFVNEYASNVERFYSWLWGRQSCVHREDFERLDQMKAEVRHLFEEAGYGDIVNER